MERYDIAVIGAGPAGSTAARSAAQRGKRVCIFERSAIPGTPVRCGEGIGYKGLTRAVDPEPEWILLTAKKAAMYSPSQLRVEMGDVGHSIILDREKMDYDLARQAVESGAHLFVSHPVTAIRQIGAFDYEIDCPQRSVRASIVIIADGVESKLARSLGWNTSLDLKDLETCAFAHVSSPLIESSTVVFYTGGAVAPGGYAWIFPRAKGEANVGLGILGSRSTAGKARELLLKFIDRELPGARYTDLHCGGVPVCRWTRPLVREGVMLVGDAARQVNCMTGAGIAYALFAGKTAGGIAAEAIGDGKIDKSHLLTYEKTWKKVYGRQQDRSFALKEFILTVDDAFLDKVAASLIKEDPSHVNQLRVFIRAFSHRPLLLLKAFMLFR